MKTKNILIPFAASIVASILVSSFLFAGRVSKVEQFPAAAAAACEGQSLGAQCTIEFVGGHVSFGVCVKVPNGNGQLTCQIDLSQLPANCHNNALGTTGSWITFGGLALAFLMMRRKRMPLNNS